MAEKKKKMPGLVLTAGGARGAYQAGVLKRIGEIRAFEKGPSPFPIIAGASAGAINGACVASGSADFKLATLLLENLWKDLKIESVFRTDIRVFGKLSFQFIRDFALGGLLGGGRAQSLLDARPLSRFLKRVLPLKDLQPAIDQGHLYALAVTATNYYTGKSFTFIHGQKGHPTWQKSRRVTLSTPIQVEHICASSAIPVVFQPVMVKTSMGDFYFGDGALRLTTPLSPAIRLGADRVFAIGVRSQKVADVKIHKVSSKKKPPLAQVAGVILNSIFLDHLDADIEHLIRINEIIQKHSAGEYLSLKEPIHRVDPLSMSPSADLGKLAETYADKMPPVVRYFLEGLGTSSSESADLMSYVLFDSAYTKELIALGYKDATDRIDEIESFLRSSPQDKANL